MRKIIWTFGIIAGIICGGIFFLDIPEPGEPMNFEDGKVWGYVSMIVALSTIFFAIWQYRQTTPEKSVGFKKSFLIGFYITLIASVLYAIGWEIYFNLYASDFGDQYVAFQEAQLEAQGKTSEQINTILAPQKDTMEMYSDNFLFRFGMTLLEIFPVGLIISILAATVFGVFMRPKAQVKVS